MIKQIFDTIKDYILLLGFIFAVIIAFIVTVFALAYCSLFNKTINLDEEYY